MFKRQLFTLAAVLAIASASLSADVTIVTTMTMAGGMPGMAGKKPAKMVTHIKGMKSTTVIDTPGMAMSTIVDLANRRVIMLNSQAQTAQVFDGSTPAAPTGTAPKVDVNLKTTGNTRTIQGVECSEHVYQITLNMDEMMGGAQVAPEAAAMLAGITMRLDGSTWAASSGPGADEYMAFMKAAVERNIMEVMTAGSGMPGGLDQVMAATTQAPGIPYLTEVTMTVEGAGQAADMMRKMGPMKMRMEVTSVSTDPVADSLFEIPQGYKTVK